MLTLFATPSVIVAQAGSSGTGNIMSQFLITLLLGIICGVLFLIFILPRLGDLVGSFFFLPSTKATPQSNLAQEVAMMIDNEDFHTALQLCLKNTSKQQNDNLSEPLLLASTIYETHLDDAQSAADLLQTKLDDPDILQKLEPEERARLRFRLADIYLEELEQKDSATAQWTLITEEQEEGRHRANALHLLRKYS